jgi:glycosyltransferase involved in cell wall biosynthesis
MLNPGKADTEDTGAGRRIKGRVSLIVTTRNEAGDIGNCLESLLRQDYPDTEVILIDNASSDGTPDIARTLGVRVEDRGPERSAQRNHGFTCSSGEFVCFLDADMIAPPNMTTECVECLSDRDTGAVVIPEVSFGDGFWTECKILERSCYGPGECVEAARFFKSSVITELGGFDEELTGLEDLDLHRRCLERWKIAYAGTPIRHHEGRIQFFDQLRKKFRYGKLSWKYAAKHPRAFRQQGCFIRPGFIRNWRKLANRPLLTAAMLTLKLAEVSAGGAGVLAGCLARSSKENQDHHAII